jgi:hypothetical protein
LVSGLFWTILFPMIGHTNFVDVHCHAINTLITLTDLALSALPFYLLHSYQVEFGGTRPQRIDSLRRSREALGRINIPPAWKCPEKPEERLAIVHHPSRQETMTHTSRPPLPPPPPRSQTVPD